jgi:transposase-like protein
MTQTLTPLQLREMRTNTMLDIGITPIYDYDENYWVQSQNSSKKYKTTLNSCSCPDNKAGFICKHILLLKKHLDKESVTDEIKCLNCSSNNLKKNGTRAVVSGKKQRWLCLDCSHSFVMDDIRENKASVEIVVLCMDKYMKGSSYRQIANSLKQFHNLKVSQMSVMRWVKRYTEVISNYTQQYTLNVSDTWHTDEQFIKVRGKVNYVWNCMDNETRFLLASNVTEKRTTANARTLFKKAKQTANKKAQLVITDGAFAYSQAVRKEFMTYKNKNPHYRYVSLRQKDSNNNIVERYHGTFRQREKNMRCMKTLKGTNMFNKGFAIYYNFIKPHMSLDNKTHAQAGGIKFYGNWEDLMRSALKNPIERTLAVKEY